MMSSTSTAIPEYRSASDFNHYGRTSQFSASSAHGSMDGRPRPLEPDLKSAESSSPTHSPDLIGTFGGLQNATINRPFRPTDECARPTLRNPLRDWYNSQDKPWDPIHGRSALQPQTRDLRANKLNYRPSGTAFDVYRESNVPSECESTGPGVLPSDSGYESRTRHSVVNGSIYGDCDRTGETGSTSSHLPESQLDRLLLSSEPWPQQGSGQTPATSANVGSSKFECSYCKQKVKTRSELKKHNQKHEKPHRCDVPNCTRTEGFSTLNDVDRHKRSRHPEHNVNGKYYQCPVPGCRNKDKKWPRADNFRSHLKRLHQLQPGEDLLEAYVCKAPSVSGPDSASPGASIEDGLISMGNTHHGAVLNSNSWQFVDPRTTLLAIQEQTLTDPGTTNYSDRHSEYLQDTVMNRQHYQALSAYGATEQIPAAVMQMSHFEPGTENVLAHHEDDHPQAQDHRTLTESIDMSSEDEFNEADYLVEESVSGRDAPEDEERDDTQHAAPDFSDDRKTGQVAGQAVQSAQNESEMTSVESEGTETSSNALTKGFHARPATVSFGNTTSASNRDQRMPDDAAVIAQLENTELKDSSIIRHIVNDKSKASDLIKALEDQGALTELLQKLGYQKSREVDSGTNTALSGRNIASDDNQVICKEPNCGKVFPRPCELKKHQKRHDKPYGCTFPRCLKSFGSKNDWKRHENSQHHQLELWKCNETSKTDPTRVCGKACHRREQFKVHLSRDHGIADPSMVDLKIDECRIGRNCEVRFWCGFCREIVEVQEGGPKAWTERFNHIDNHFSGRRSVKRNISEWVDPDSPDIDLNSSILMDESRSIFTRPSGPSYETDHPRKRGAEAGSGSHNSRSRKRSRVGETWLWFCCHCGNQSLMSTSMHCCMDDCDGHFKCTSCRTEKVPREPVDLE